MLRAFELLVCAAAYGPQGAYSSEIDKIPTEFRTYPGKFQVQAGGESGVHREKWRCGLKVLVRWEIQREEARATALDYSEPSRARGDRG